MPWNKNKHTVIDVFESKKILFVKVSSPLRVEVPTLFILNVSYIWTKMHLAAETTLADGTLFLFYFINSRENWIAKAAYDQTETRYDYDISHR